MALTVVLQKVSEMVLSFQTVTFFLTVSLDCGMIYFFLAYFILQTGFDYDSNLFDLKHVRVTNMQKMAWLKSQTSVV